MDSFGSNNSLQNTSEKCLPYKKDFIIVLTIFPGFVAIENLVFLLAIFLYRRKLKHSNVYRYVASTLMANFVISTLGFYHFFNYYFGFEPHGPNLWWAFRKGMQLALSLVLCGNIGLLIYGIHNSTYIVERKLNFSHEMRQFNPVYRRRKANGLIALVWALPTAYGLLSITPWNCTTGQCTCTLWYKSGNLICTGESCSQLYTPMAKSYLFVVFLLWSLECLGLLGIFVRSVLDLHKAQNQIKKSVSFWQALAKSLSRFKVLYLLFLFFLFCTGPVMVLFALDFSIPQIKFNHTLVNFLIPLPLAYCLICPLFLRNKLTGVKAALTMIFKCSCRCSSAKNRESHRQKFRRPMSVSVANQETTSF